MTNICARPPEATTDHQRRSLVMWFKNITTFKDYFDSYIRDLRAFPGAETVNAVARDVVLDLVASPLEVAALQMVDIVDPRTLRVTGVCPKCGFGFAGRMAQFARDMANNISRETGRPALDMDILVPGGPSEINGVRYMITKDRDGSPILLIGYLEHESRFADLLNNELAQKVTLAITVVLMDVVTEVMAKLVIQQRAIDNMIDSLNGAFEIDRLTLQAKMSELDAQLREEMGTYDEPEATDEPEASLDADEPVDEDALSASSADGTDEADDTGTSTTDEPEADNEADDTGSDEPEPEADDEVIVSDETVDGNDGELDVPIEAPEEEISPPPAS